MHSPSDAGTSSQANGPDVFPSTRSTRTKVVSAETGQSLSRRNLGKLAAAGAAAVATISTPRLVMASAIAPEPVAMTLFQPDDSAELASQFITEETGAPTPANSELRKIANDALDAVKRSFSAIAQDSTASTQDGSLEQVFQDAIATMSAERQESLQSTAAILESLPAEARELEFGRYGQLDAAAFVAASFATADSALPPLAIDSELLGFPAPSVTVPVSQLVPTDDGLLIPATPADGGAAAVAMPADWTMAVEAADAAVEQAATEEIFNVEQIAELWDEPLPLVVTAPNEAASAAVMACEDCLEVADDAAVADAAAAVDAAPAAAGTKIHFYIKRIKCVDETNPEWWGSDEIALGGAYVTPTGKKADGWWVTKEIPQTKTWGGFDDGNTKTFSPPLEVTKAAFPLGGSAPWPRLYSATLLLAEKDEGGLGTAIDKIWNLVGAKVKAAIAAAVAAAVSATVLGSVVAAAVAYAVSYVIERFVQWVIDRFKDDIFAPAFLRVKVPSPSATWNGSKKSPVGRAVFSGHGGQYSVEYYWHIA